MKPPSGPPSRIADLLGTILKRVDPDQQLPAYALWNFWDDEVGAHIAARAQPARFRNGILFVTVATHSWMQELQFLKEDIRQRLNARLAANLVRDIFFVVGHVAGEPPPPLPAASSAVPPCEPIALPPSDNAELGAAMSRVVAARARHLTRMRQEQVRRGRTRKPR